jgi:hypothetical protein
MVITTTPVQPRVALDPAGVRAMALTIATHLTPPGEQHPDESVCDYAHRCVAHMRLASLLVQVNPDAAAVIMATLSSL